MTEGSRQEGQQGHSTRALYIFTLQDTPHTLQTSDQRVLVHLNS